MSALKFDFSVGHKRFWSWVNSCPALEGAPGTATQDVEELATWAAYKASSGERAAAAFALGVWNGHKWPDLDHFDIRDVGSMGHAEREWMIAWLREPWWP